jgi:hypothetical protein
MRIETMTHYSTILPLKQEYYHTCQPKHFVPERIKLRLIEFFNRHSEVKFSKKGHFVECCILHCRGKFCLLRESAHNDAIHTITEVFNFTRVC